MKKLGWSLLAVLVAVVLVFGVPLYQELEKVRSDAPTAWEKDIAALEQQTLAAAPPGDAVLFVGSSSIRLWKTLAEDMAPIPVIQHGFGGAKINDVVHYVDRLVNRWNPQRVVIFVGTNDINGNAEHHLAPGYIGERLTALLDAIFAANPASEVFYIAITPTLLSWDKFDSVQRANTIAAAVCETYDNATFIATEDLFLNAAGEPDEALFVFDGLHLNAQGYARWTSRIKPYLQN